MNPQLPTHQPRWMDLLAEQAIRLLGIAWVLGFLVATHVALGKLMY